MQYRGCGTRCVLRYYWIRIAPSLNGSAISACWRGLEGVVSKWRGSPSRSGPVAPLPQEQELCEAVRWEFGGLGKVVDMSESKTRLIPADKTRVNVYERHELNYWTQKWRCTEAELRAAVEATNSIMADKIETHLMQKR